ncbi:hypothetical protein VM1G_10404 [Cytospora mali]|uniref:Uncharacterized protein n=1 Tax=Cytospora mali TaxID=578113 RepID=A0A194VHV9_CYTMA|nr:hypothetical protein VM1G_10404 [Valsa mali]
MSNFLFNNKTSFGLALTYGEQDANQHICTQHEHHAIASPTGLFSPQKCVAGTLQGNTTLFSESKFHNSDLGHEQFDPFHSNGGNQNQVGAAVANAFTQGTDPYDQEWSQQRPATLYAPTPLRLLPSAMPRYLTKMEDLLGPAGEGSSLQRSMPKRITGNQEESTGSPSSRVSSKQDDIAEVAVARFKGYRLGSAVLKRIKRDGKATFHVQPATVEGKKKFQIQLAPGCSTSAAEGFHHATTVKQEAQKICSKKVIAGITFYRVAWKSTWELESSLMHALDLLKDWKEKKAARPAGRGMAPKDRVQKRGPERKRKHV